MVFSASVFKKDQVGWGAQDCITQWQIYPEGVWHGFVCLSFVLFFTVHPLSLSNNGSLCHFMRVYVGNTEVITEDSIREFSQSRHQAALLLFGCAPSPCQSTEKHENQEGTEEGKKWKQMADNQQTYLFFISAFSRWSKQEVLLWNVCTAKWRPNCNLSNTNCN